jgi:hypothetical protein
MSDRARRDVHVRISRIVVDRAALSGDTASADGWRVRLTDRIAEQIAAAPAEANGPSSSTLIDSIASAVAARVSPHVRDDGGR